jgi:tetratricopeptide (TPR) repeat protein
MMRTTTKQRELIHWLWLWMLAAIAVTVMQGLVAGQQAQSGGKPIPMPNVDHPEWFEYPEGTEPEGKQSVGLNDLIRWQHAGNFKQALKGWQSVRVAADSRTWQELGIGVSYLKLGRLETAVAHLESALERDETNAIAEYFLGRVRQAQGRQIPFWYDSEEEAPFRLASIVQPSSAGERSFQFRRVDRSKMFLPRYIDDAYDRLARQHFRRAVTLAPQCSLERAIRLAPAVPVVQLTSLGDLEGEKVTIGDLLDSWGERDFVRRAKAELGLPRASSSLESGSEAITEPMPLH